jgi:SAM-dependent methyltransferase
MSSIWRKIFFDLQYRFSKPPWDSGVTPSEVTAFVESSSSSSRGRALDIGCGTGTNAIYLAQRGFTVVGIDFAPRAIAVAREKARRAGIAVEFHVGDVTRLDALGAREPFDFALDIGCFHALDVEGRARYAQGLARRTRAGSVFMLYAFSPRPPGEQGHLIKIRNVGATPAEVQQTFAQHFALTRIEHGSDWDERASAWYWFTRK